MNADPAHDELTIRIEPGRDDAYRVIATGPDEGTATGTLRLPFSRAGLDRFVRNIGAVRTRGGFRDEQLEAAKAFGAELAAELLRGDVRDAYAAAVKASRNSKRPLRVTLNLTSVPALMEVPWEYLYDDGFLSSSKWSPVVRALDQESPRSPAKVKLPLRILGMVSSPSGVEQLDAEREQDNLEVALAPLRERDMVTLNWVKPGTLEQLQREIAAKEEEHILHYIGHGAYDRQTHSGVLKLEDAHGGPRIVSGEDLCTAVRDEWSLRLVVLNSCEGARVSHVDPFSGIASSLVECGIPAVVGMQFEITDEAAITFSRSFYTSLTDGYNVEAAVSLARQAILAAGQGIEFGSPVLFLGSSAHTHIFDLDRAEQPEARPQARPQPAPRPEREAAPVEHQPPAVAERSAEEARDLFEKHASEFEGGGLKETQKRQLRNLIEPGEALLGMCRCAPLDAVRRATVVVFTSRRLLWSRSAIFRVESGEVLWDDVRAVEAQEPNGIRLVLTDGADLCLTKFDGSGVAIDDPEMTFTPRAVLEFVRRQMREPRGEPAAPGDRPQSWTVEVTHSTKKVRALRVRLSDETHLVKYSVGLFSDSIELDGSTVFKGGVDEERTFPLPMSDGRRTHPAFLTVRLSHSGTALLGLSLTVSGQELYTEGMGGAAGP